MRVMFNRLCARLFFYGISIAVIFYICGGPTVVNTWQWWQLLPVAAVALVVGSGVVDWWDAEDPS